MMKVLVLPFFTVSVFPKPQKLTEASYALRTQPYFLYAFLGGPEGSREVVGSIEIDS